MKNINTLPTVTVALSAFNEENNIKPFLKSVLMQEEQGFQIKEIWVFSDGSTDKTVEYAKSFKNSKIKVFSDKKRLGKTSRLNQIYKKLNTDYLLQSDADVVYSHPLVIHDMVMPLINNKSIGMCGGHPAPVAGKTFVEKSINCTFEAYAPLRKTLRGGDNVFSVDGRILSYRKELVKKIYIPPYDVTANDAFTFYACLSLGYKYKYVESAVVLFRSPQTLKDQIKQNTRFLAMPIKMSKYFPSELVLREKKIPRLMLAKNMLSVFLKHPIMCSYIYLVNWYCRLRVKSVEKSLTARWPMAYSTKDFKRLYKGKKYE